MRCFGTAAFILLALSLARETLAFNPYWCSIGCRKKTKVQTNRRIRPAAMQQDGEDCLDDELDELSPPSISFTRNSILFGKDPPTQKNNMPLMLWQETKSVLPKFVTGAWEEGKGDREPLEHLYNLIFVRIPVVLMGMLYVNNLVHGHPLYMNFGGGNTFEVPSVVVFGIIYVILR
jgi:hypothetical protein